MKRTLLTLSLLCTILFSCSKKNENNPSASLELNGRSYPTVKIGSQTWTTMNYDGPGGIASPRNDEYDYGKYYSEKEMLAIKLPDGWRVPSKEDFVKLMKSQGELTIDVPEVTATDADGAKVLKAASSWYLPGDNSSGFNILPGGYYQSFSKEFLEYKGMAYFWTTTSGPALSIDPNYYYCFRVSGRYSSPGTGSEPETGAEVRDMTTGDNVIWYNIRFVKDN
ncbi:FISUMP domain-containing protein [Mucilaginibacter litoreus]|uniref:FISUMP domain-containing protein n=1 Tax=Mucilaginibacter litoreus TaxID=1048221 RepID=A0ABW3ASH7_9SPHI